MKTARKPILATSTWPWIGQARLGALLMELADGSTWPATVMFTGPANTGKRTVALWLAQRDLCATVTGRPCQQCSSCRHVAAGTHPQCLVVAGRDGQPPNIEDLQEIWGRLHWKTSTITSGRKWVILPDVDQLNETVGNSLLKVIEEPPTGTAVLLTSSRAERVLPTIRSRAVAFRWSEVPLVELEQALAERWPGMAPTLRQTIARQSAGRPGRAVIATQRPELMTERWDTAETLMIGLQTGRWPQRRDWSAADLDQVELVVRDAMLVSVGTRPQTWPHERSRLEAFATACGAPRLLMMAMRLLQRANYLRQHVQPSLFLYDLSL